MTENATLCHVALAHGRGARHQTGARVGYAL